MKLNLQNRLLKFLNIKILILLTLSVILLDELSKILAQKYFAVSCNRGIAFGLGSEGVGKITSFLALLLIFWLLAKTKGDYIKIGLFLVFAGGLANLVDRVFSGCARDFIAISIFPSFNISDIVITLGVILIFYTIFVANKERVPEDGNDRTF